MTSQKLSKNSKSSILIVDDAPENLRYLNELLSAQGYDIRATLDGQTALEVAQVISPDLILLDIQMPSMDGYRVSEALQKIPALKETPIIFISALDDVEDKIKAFRAGGVDYISKPFEAQEVIARVGAHIQLHQSKQEVQKLLEQQDYFIKKIMHEMNTPVSVIKLCAQALEVQAGSNSQISTINASAKILASIYDDLGYLIRKEHHEYPRESIKLLEFVSDRISYFHEVASVKNITVDLELNLEYKVHMNKIELERLVDNTLSNAIKYSNENGEVHIFIGIEDDKYVLVFEDKGIGIKETEKIFEQYYQASDNSNGLGIGMATVKEICEQNNIEITIKSEQNEGSIFEYCFDNAMVVLS